MSEPTQIGDPMQAGNLVYFGPDGRAITIPWSALPLHMGDVQRWMEMVDPKYCHGGCAEGVMAKFVKSSGPTYKCDKGCV